jgi:hypothetical protein
LEDAQGSGLVNERSNPLKLLNPYTAFRSEMILTPPVDSLICEPGKDVANFSLNFKKLTKLDLPLTIEDSIRISLPVSMGLVDTIQIEYSYPAYSSVAAISGKITPDMLTEQVINDSVRYISWQLPVDYYTALTGVSLIASGEVTGNYRFSVKNKRLIQERDTVFVQTSTLTQVGPGGDCPTITAVADTSNRQQFILVPSRNTSLTSLSVNDRPVDGFTPDKFEYDVLLPCETDWISIVGTPYSDCLQVYGVYNERLEQYFKRFEVIVTAEDGVHTQTYVVNARPLMPAKILEDLPVDQVACQSIDYTLGVRAEGDSLYYRWYLHHDSIPYNNSDKLLLSDPQMTTEYGYYHVEVYGACRSADTSATTRVWVADKLPERMIIEDIPDQVYAGQRYRIHIGMEYGYEDVTNFIWSFCDTTGTCYDLGGGRTGQTIHTNFPGTKPGVLRVDMTHPCAAYFGPYYAAKELDVINLTGIDNPVAGGVHLYPNPFENELKILSENGLESVIVTDISGRRIASYSGLQESELTIPASSWAKGAYMVTIRTTEGILTHKVIKK